MTDAIDDRPVGVQIAFPIGDEPHPLGHGCRLPPRHAHLLGEQPRWFLVRVGCHQGGKAPADPVRLTTGLTRG